MPFSYRIAVAMLAALPAAAIAEQKAGPADATAASAAAAYESVFKSYRGATEEQESPDKAWRAANEMVGKLGGHSGQMGQSGDAEQGESQSEPGAEKEMPMQQKHGAHH